MLHVTCFLCKKKYTIDHSDSQYQKIKRNPKAYYVCKKCNKSMKEEAQQKTGINPDMIDKYDKYL